MQPNTPDNTLVSTDQIDGGANSENHLQVTLRGDFMDGFGTHTDEAGATVSNLQNVQQIDLVNPNNQQYQFNAQNAASVDNWQLINTSNQNGSIELFNLPKTGITVGLNGQIQGAANIAFDPTVVTGSNDAMTVELNNVGRVKTSTTPQTVVDLNTESVENLTLVSNGTARNLVDLSNFAQGTNLTITGAADLSIIPSGGGKDALPAPLQKIDATAATGDITITTFNPANLKTILMGSGDDVINAHDLYAMATINGGGGNDLLHFDYSTAASTVNNYHLNMTGVETLTVDGNNLGAALTFDGSNTQGLETLNLINANQDISYVKANQSDLDVNINGTAGVAKNYEVTGIQVLTVTYGKNDATDEAYTGHLTTNARDLNIVMSGAATDEFKGEIIANNAASITLDTGANSKFDTFHLDAENATTLTINTGPLSPSTSSVTLGTYDATKDDLNNISTIVINGWGNVDLSENSHIGSEQAALTVKAGEANGNFTASFAGSETANRINITGSATGDNAIAIGGIGCYDEQIRVDGSTGADTISVYIESVESLMEMVDAGRFNLTLLTGNNQVAFNAIDGTTPLNISIADFKDLNAVITGEGLDKSAAAVGDTEWGLTITA